MNKNRNKNRMDKKTNKHKKSYRKAINKNKVVNKQIIHLKRTNRRRIKIKLKKMMMTDGLWFQNQSQRRNNNQMMIWTKMKDGSLRKTMIGKWLKGQHLFRIK